ncbi:hypothetical protein SCLCIDRAFT_1213798 [Scleroderma citrinum Foug A]|uniref:Uncharacterized protein n=1 Tax=Scleroderma citrinum Foug A TaxID=1036808 RepID=A0A0C3E6A9_9AGAM|nr:hypothetical protein SCLCIDRAFT_1213798 [Scleroderma citrinum Foug A]
MSMSRLLHCSFRLADARQLLLTRGRATFATTRPGRAQGYAEYNARDPLSFDSLLSEEETAIRWERFEVLGIR